MTIITQVKLLISKEHIILPKIKTGRLKQLNNLVIQTTHLFTLQKKSNKEEIVNSNINVLTNSNLPERKSFKEDKLIESKLVESDSETNNNAKLSELPILKNNINFTCFGLEQGYDNFKKLFSKQYQIVTVIENTSAPITLNTYTVYIF